MAKSAVGFALAALLSVSSVQAQGVSMMGSVDGGVTSLSLGQFTISDINDAGQVVGTFTRFFADCYHGFFWSPGWSAPLDLGCGRAFDVGEPAAGVVRVVGTGVGAYAHATIWEIPLAGGAFTATDIHDARVPNAAGEFTSALTSINSRGEIAGTTGSGIPFLLRGDQTQPVLRQPYRYTGVQINDYGAIVADHSTPQGSANLKQLYEHGRLSFIHDMGEVVAINNRGMVAGRRTYDEPQWRAVVYENGETRELQLPAGMSFSGVSDMNDAGQILGQVDDEWNLSDARWYKWSGTGSLPASIEFGQSDFPNCRGCWGHIVQAKINNNGVIAGVAKYMPDVENPSVMDAGFIMAPAGPPSTIIRPVSQVPVTATVPSAEKGLIVYVNRTEQAHANPDLYIMKGDGSEATRLTSTTAEENNPDVSPDGAMVAFESDRDGNFEIYRMSLNGTNVVRLTNHSGRDKTPAWSPDGQKIAFARYANRNWDIWVMNAVDGSGLVNLTNTAGADEVHPSWSPGGERIAYASNVSGHFEIHDVLVGFGAVRALTSQAAPSGVTYGNRFQPLHSTSGRLAYVEQWFDSSEIYDIDPDAAASPVLLTGCSSCPFYTEAHSWSSDARRLAFTNYQDDPYGRVMVVDTTNPSDPGAVLATGSSAPDWVPSVSGYPGGNGVPGDLVAVATSASRVALGWSAVTDATGYEVFRKSGPGDFAFLASSDGTTFADTAVLANKTYVYAVRSLRSSGPSALSNSDAATTIVFTDDPLMPGSEAKALHITQLRTAVNAMLTAAGLTPRTFPSLGAGTVIEAEDVTELRIALINARNAIGLPSMSAFTDPTITSRSTPVRAAHVNQLRNGVD